MSEIDVSIVMPALNASSTIGEALASCLDQTLRSIEVIVVDDGSKDDTAKVVERVARRADLPIRLIRHENRGRGAARDTGVAAARGRFIGFVDSDDVADPEMYSLLLGRALETESDVVVCGYVSFDSNTGETMHLYGEGSSTMYGTGLLGNPDLLTVVSSSVCNKIFRRDLFERARIRFPSGDFEDLAVTYPLLLAAHRIEKVDRILYRYRRGQATSIMSTHDDRYFLIFDALSDVNAAFARAEAGRATHAQLEWLNIVHALSGRVGDLLRSPDAALVESYVRAAHAHLDATFPTWRNRLRRDSSFGRLPKRLLLLDPRTARFAARALRKTPS